MEAIQRLHRILTQADQEHLAEVFGPYLKGRSGQYLYRVKGKKAYHEHLQAVGQTMDTLLQDLQAEYGKRTGLPGFRAFL